LYDLDLRISEIAFAVGFQSLSQFNRVLKKLSGKSPSAYRAIHSKRTNAAELKILAQNAATRFCRKNA
jgi:AraC-like DNA-binding protein